MLSPPSVSALHLDKPPRRNQYGYYLTPFHLQIFHSMPANPWHMVVNRQLPNQDVSLTLTTFYSSFAYSYLYPAYVCKALDHV